tara:strand:+ start:936 stop:1559 length:624 start_codon:yes stop_codon:yes gene_type:complete
MKYQDFVIKNGKFVGEFEKMYQEFPDPWHQSEEIYYSSLSKRSVCYFIEKFEINSIVQWGCGLGTTTNYIKKNTNRDIDILGIDISETAINKAKKTYPNLEFKVDNVLNVSKYDKFECIFFSSLTWYILKDKTIDSVFNAMIKKFRDMNKYFIHVDNFYKGNVQQYGKEYFTSLEEFIEFCPFELLGKVQIDLERKNDTESAAIFKI